MGNPHVHHAGSLEVSDNQGFAKLMPGFEFLQNLTRSAGSSLPNIGHWVTPTLDPAEIEKRIEELRTVKFWLEQNGKMLDTTIQALEVQRMTLTTLRNMNVQMSDLREAMMVPKPEEPAPAEAPAATASDAAVAAMAAAGQAAAAFAKAFQFPKPDAAPEASEAPARRRSSARAAQPSVEAVQDDPPASSAGTPDMSDPAAEPIQSEADADRRHPSAPASPPSESTPAASSTGPVDPMQWWSTLTRQFTDIASAALQDAGTAGMAAMNTAAADHAPAQTAKPTARNRSSVAASSRKAAPANPATSRARQGAPGAPQAARSAAQRSASSAGGREDPASAHDTAHAPLPRKEAVRKPPRG